MDWSSGFVGAILGWLLQAGGAVLDWLLKQGLAGWGAAAMAIAAVIAYRKCKGTACIDWLVVRIVRILALAARRVALLISVVIVVLLLSLAYLILRLGSYESWDKTVVAVLSGVISSVITAVIFLTVQWFGAKSEYLSKNALDALGSILWRKCLWDTARARLTSQGYCRYEQRLLAGLMGQPVLIRAIYDIGNRQWSPQVVVGEEIVYGFGTGDELGAIRKDRDAALEDAWKFAKRCGLSVKIETKVIEARVLETPTRNMFVIRSLLYRSANVLCEESCRNPDGHEILIREVDGMLHLLDGARMYCAHGRWNRGERDDLVKSLMELIHKTMVALPDYEYGKEPDSDRLVKDLKNELSDVEHDLFSSAKKIVLADSNSRYETRLARYRRRVSEAPSRLWSRARGRQ